MGEKSFPQFPFVGGLDQKTERAYLDPDTKLAAVTNGNFVKIGTVDKRYGIEFIGNTVVPSSPLASPTSGQRAVSWSRSNLTMMGGAKLYSQSSTNLFTGVGYLPPPYCTRTGTNISDTTIAPVILDFPYQGTNYRLSVFTNQTNNFYGTVIDRDSGTVVLEPTLVFTYGTGAAPTIINSIYLPNAPDGYQVQVFVRDGAGSVWSVKYTSASQTFASPALIIAGGYMDVAPYVNDPLGGYLVAGYGINANIQVYYLSYSGSLVSESIISAVGSRVSAGPIYVNGTYGEGVYAAFQTQTTFGTVNEYFVSQFSGDHALTPLFGGPVQAGGLVPTGGSAAAALAGICRVDSTHLLVTWQQLVNPGGSQGIETFDGGWFVYASGGFTGYGSTPCGFVTQAAPFVVNGTAYQVCLYLNKIQANTQSPASEQVTMYLMQWQSLTGYPTVGNVVLPVATIAKNVVNAISFASQNALTLGHMNLMSTTAIGATRFACGVSTLGTEVSALSGSVGPAYIVDYYFDATSQSSLYQSQELGSVLHVSGAVPFVFDSQTANEDNFFYFPEWTYATLNVSNPALLQGTYGYATNYAAIDSSGLIHRSAPAYSNQLTNVPSTPPVVVGTTNVTSSELYGLSGTLNTPATVTGTKDVTQSSLYGANGTLNSPNAIGFYDMTTAALYGAGGLLDGTTMILAVDTGGSATLTLSGSGNASSMTALFQAIHTKWPTVTATINQNNYLVLTTSTPIGSGGQIQILGGTAWTQDQTTAISGSQALPAGTITVAAGGATLFNASGRIQIAGTSGVIHYTGKTSNTFTGCTGGTGTAANGALVTVDGSGAHNVMDLLAGSPPTAAWQGGPSQVAGQGFSGGFTLLTPFVLFSDVNATVFPANPAVTDGILASFIVDGDPVLANNGTWYHNYNNNYGGDATDLAVTFSTGNQTGNPPVSLTGSEADAWGLGGSPTTKVLWLNVNGAGFVPLVIDAVNLQTSSSKLIAAIAAKWPALNVTINTDGDLVLTTNTTGTANSIVVGYGTANPMLGLRAGASYAGGTTTLMMAVNGGSILTLPLNVSTNAASYSTLVTAIQAKWPFLTVTTNAAGNIILTDSIPGSSETIQIGSGTANSVLGLTPGTTAGIDSTGSMSLTIPALSATWRSLYSTAYVFVEIYRTTANGSIYYLIDRIAAIQSPGSPTITWPASGGDNTTDSELDTSSYVYTTGGVLPNVNPPAFNIQIAHNGRIIGIDETLQQAWPSQAFSPGTAPGYSGALVVPFGEGGNITAVASMDGALYVFKESSIFVMFGNNGPAVTGQGSDWTVPQRTSTNVGALSQAGICNTDIGVFFQSATGIYLLGRDRSVTFVGKAVIDTLTSYPTITSATLVPSATQVRFTCTNGSTTTTIVYDYLLQEWVTHTYPYLTAPVVSSCMTSNVPQQFSLLTTDGYVWQENLTTAAQPWMDLDSSSVAHFVPTVITLAPIKTVLQGYVRALYVQLLTFLQSGSNMCGLQVQLAVNYNPTVVQTTVFPVSKLVTSPNPGQVNMYLGAQYNQAMAYQFTLSDVDPGVVGQTGQGARFVNLTMALEQLGAVYPFLPVNSKQ